jgi:hypothetical protein
MSAMRRRLRLIVLGCCIVCAGGTYASGGGLWLVVFASGVYLQFASALKATVVHSDEGTLFYLFSGFSL